MAAKVLTKQLWEGGLPLGVTVEMMVWRLLAHHNVRLEAACIEFVYKCFSAFLPTRSVNTENLSSVCRHLQSVNWAHLLQNSIKSELIAQWFYLFMSSYREGLWGNWFYHYQRAETARVRDKGVKKICLHLLFLYTLIPPSIPSSFSLCFFFWSVSPFQVLNHQTTILLSALLVTAVVPVIVHLHYLMCARCANIHLHTVGLCLWGGP